MQTRPYTAADQDAVCSVLGDAVHSLASAHYTPEQREAWVRHLSPDALNEKLLMGYTLVREDAQGILAFAQLHPIHHINYLYTHPRAARQGHARELIASLEKHAHANGMRGLITEASETSRPCFEACGYTVIEAENVVRHGEVLSRYCMKKTLS